MGKRRAQGDGALFARNKGTKRKIWIGPLQMPDGTRVEVSGKTQAVARQKLESAKEAAAKNLRVKVSKQTTGEFLTRWLEDTARPALRPTTYAAYETRVWLYLIPRIGRVPLAQLGPQHVQKLQNDLLQTSRLPKNRVGEGCLSPATVLDTRRVLSRALGQAVKWGMIPRNPVPLVDPPGVQRPEMQPLDRLQARTLLETLRGNRLEALYTVALALGLRKREALGLKWSDVDLTEGTIIVRRALYRAGGKLQLTDVKTRKSRRTVALPLVATRALVVHRKRQDKERETAANLWQKRDLVFTTAFGGPLEPRNVNRHFAGVLKAAGLPHQRFHDLRHACASLLLAQGLDLKVVQEVLGHSSITITADLYAHVLMGLKREAASGMDAALESGGGHRSLAISAV
jgi:integrase